MKDRFIQHHALLVTLSVLLGTLVSLSASGCRAHLDRFSNLDPESSLAVLARRQQRIAGVQAIGAIELVTADGDSVRFDTAMVASPPMRLRLRGWKFDRAVFDVTLLDEEVWVYRPDASGADAQFANMDEAVRGLGFLLDILSGAFYESAVVQESSSTTTRLVARGSIRNTVVECTIDRLTLTAREFAATDGSATLFVTLDDYRMVSETAWPFRVHLVSPDGELKLRFHEVDLNDELSPNAFTPPPMATRYP